MGPPRAISPILFRALSTDAITVKPAKPVRPAVQAYRHRIPPYPYGPALHFTQSDTGLYGGSRIQFGNKISAKFDQKSRRSWHPNIHKKRLWSDALGKFIQVKVQARVLRTMDKVGGLDEYLLGDKPARIKELGIEGWRLRWKVMNSKKVRDRFREERIRLGLPPEGWVEEKKEPEMVPVGDVDEAEDVETLSEDTLEEDEGLEEEEEEEEETALAMSDTGAIEEVMPKSDAGVIEEAMSKIDADVIKEARIAGKSILKEIDHEIAEQDKALGIGGGEKKEAEDPAGRDGEHQTLTIPSKEELEQMGIKMPPAGKRSSGPTREKLEEVGVRLMLSDGKTLRTSVKNAWGRVTGRSSEK